MEDILIITFDYKPGDVPVLLVSKKMYETKLEVINEFTGNIAVTLYNFLKKDNRIVINEKKDEPFLII